MEELTNSQKIRYKLAYATIRCLSVLPLEVLFFMADVIYPFVKAFYRRKVVRQNLIEAFPNKSKEEIGKIESNFYHHFCDTFAEIVKQFSFSREQMMEHMQMKGLEPVQKGFDDGKFLLIAYLGHYGNWEWIASLQYWFTDVLCSQVYHPLYNKVADRLFLNLREQYGGECIPMKKVARRLVQMRDEKLKVVCGMISDQLPKWNSIHHFTPFLNHDTAVFTGSEQLGKKFDAMFYYGRITCVKRGYYVCEWIPITHNPKEFEDYELTDRYMRLLEKDIEQHPEMWLWTHKRWRRTKEEWLNRQNRAENE